MTAARRLLVVHLVRQANGMAPFRRFLDSYRAHDTGTPHELVLLFKGFARDPEIAPYRKLASDVSSRSVSVPDAGHDLGAYFAAASRLGPARLCFLNSFTTIRAPRWLEILAAALDQQGAGLVGATGSWGSHASHVRYDSGLGGPYAGILPDRARTREVFRSLGDAAGEEPGPVSLPRRAGTAARTIVRLSTGFEPFPAHHVRTNAFMVERDVLRAVRAATIRDKVDAYRLESGTRSVTRQIEEMGLRAVVVDRDGRCYERADWPRSRTFWQADQRGRLIDDKQTSLYRDGDPVVRATLARYAWGPEAEER